MDDQKRQKILGGALAAVLGFMFIRPDKALLEPIRKAEQNRENAQADFESEELKHMQLLVARENNSRGRATSLPHSISDAQRLYQTWITNLAEQCRFSRLQVSPGRTEYRRGQYLTVNVDIEAETDLDGISRFLYLADQANLMHRISSLEINSTGSQSNPRMEVVLSAQGMSVAGSPDRSDVFPRTQMTEPITRDATEMTVTDTTGFPKEPPFLAQVGKEMVSITAVNETAWSIERGQENTAPAEHTVNDNVQLFPVSLSRKSASYDDYKALIAASPFTKPKPPRQYRPRIASITDKTIKPGEEVKMTARAEDFDKDIGDVSFTLEEAAEGMTIDSDSGEFTWVTAEDLKPDAYSGTVVLTQKNNPELRVEKKFAVTIRLPNDAPKLNVKDKAVVILGQEFSMAATAEDDGPAAELKFSLDGEVPEGLSVDASSGAISWAPPKTLTPKEYVVTVKVTDGGTPPLEDSTALTFSVEDDHAILTKFTGSVALDGVSSAMFRNLGTNDRPVLKIGERVVVSEIDAEVREISNRHILLADAAGVWKLNLGDNLRERELVEPAPTSAPAAADKKEDEGAPKAETDDPPEPETAAGPSTTAAETKPSEQAGENEGETSDPAVEEDEPKAVDPIDESTESAKSAPSESAEGD